MHSYTYPLQSVALTTSTQGNVAYSPAIPYRRLVLLEGKCCFIKHKQYCSRTVSAVHPRDISPQVAR